MKQISGASGTRCTFYCCPSHCDDYPFYTYYGSCESNEQCQYAGEQVFECTTPGDYVAALCKG
ncbi:hypothetical protein [Mucilaginibacter puniceus]